MLSLPVCGTAHRVFCRSCPSIPSSRSRLRPKRSRPPHWARKTTWICSDNACYPDKRYPFSDTSQFLSIRTVQAAASQGNGGFLLLLRTLSSPRKYALRQMRLRHASSLSASSLHSPQECFARSAFAASIADADMDRLVTPRPHSTGRHAGRACHLAAHADFDTVLVRCFGRHGDQAQHARMQRTVQIGNLLVDAVHRAGILNRSFVPTRRSQPPSPAHPRRQPPPESRP